MASFVLHFSPTYAFKTFTVRATHESVNGGPFVKTSSGGPVILEIPLNKIRRPLMRTRANDPEKVQELMESIGEIGLQVPIDVLEVDGVYYGSLAVFLVVTGMRLTNVLDSPLSAVKCAVELKKLSDITCAEWKALIVMIVATAIRLGRKTVEND